ncbi:hypothetical protein B0H63DRAFT_488851 [Podospora didyma]|uniref:Uncharacterized protein n=1 Tax=Podospora didyma TaxID=330526 RepID=A0AAE0N3C7_9PEZI|nr:hypothetical protein B0H63DRAFT_488851 [Podospora didyma]
MTPPPVSGFNIKASNTIMFITASCMLACPAASFIGRSHSKSTLLLHSSFVAMRNISPIIASQQISPALLPTRALFDGDEGLEPRALCSLSNGVLRIFACTVLAVVLLMCASATTKISRQ